jgi:hypothetical protein
MGGTWYTVRAGDTLSKIASQHGFADWRTIYRQNTDFFRKSRRDDPNWIEPGDRLLIPEKLSKKISCSPGKQHQFRVRKVAPLKDDEEIIGDARKAHKAYLDVRDDYVKWMIDPDNCAKRYLGEWCEGLAKEKKFKKVIDTARLDADKHAAVEEAKKKHELIEKRADEYIAVLSGERLLRQLRRMGAAGQREWASLVQGMGESVAGGKWIERELKNEEGFWASLGTKEGSAEAAEKSEGIKKPFEFAEPFFDALGEFVGTIVRVKRETAVDYIAQVVAVRFRVRAVDLVTKDVLEIRGGMVAAVLYQRRVTYLTKTRLLDAKTAEAISHGASGVLDAFGKVIAVVNFAAKLDVLCNDPSLKNWISATGALAELLGAFESVNEYVNSFVRTGRTLGEDGAPKALEAATEVGEAGAKVAVEGAEEVALGFGEVVIKGFAKRAGVLAVVAGLADAITGSMEAYEEYDKGNFTGMSAKLAVATGGLLVAAGATICMAGGAVTATVAGAPLGVVLLVTGTLVAAAGAIAGWIWSESDLEVWAEHCLYGKRYGKDKYASYAGDFKKQMEELSEVLYQVRVKGDLRQDVTELEIEASNLTKASKMTCFVTVQGDDFGSTTMGARGERPLRDDESDCRIEFVPEGLAEKDAGALGNPHLKKVTLRVSMPYATGSYLSGKARVNWTKMTIGVGIDAQGDGQNKLKRLVEVKQGIFAWVWAKV